MISCVTQAIGLAQIIHGRGSWRRGFVIGKEKKKEVIKRSLLQ